MPIHRHLLADTAELQLCPFRNGRFCPKTRPHKGFHRRRSSATSRMEARGERSIRAKDAIYGWTLTVVMGVPTVFVCVNVGVGNALLVNRYLSFGHMGDTVRCLREEVHVVGYKDVRNVKVL